MQITRGDSFLLALIAKVDGVAQDLTNWQVRSSIGSALGVIHDLAVGYTDRVAGAYTLSAETAGWPIGDLKFDILYTTDVGQVVHTSPIQVTVVKGVTL
jgi:hypothetical protein